MNAEVSDQFLLSMEDDAIVLLMRRLQEEANRRALQGGLGVALTKEEAREILTHNQRLSTPEELHAYLQTWLKSHGYPTAT